MKCKAKVLGSDSGWLGMPSCALLTCQCLWLCRGSRSSERLLLRKQRVLQRYYYRLFNMEKLFLFFSLYRELNLLDFYPHLVFPVESIWNLKKRNPEIYKYLFFFIFRIFSLFQNTWITENKSIILSQLYRQQLIAQHVFSRVSVVVCVIP
jgi:hypothetical protein